MKAQIHKTCQMKVMVQEWILEDGYILQLWKKETC